MKLMHNWTLQVIRNPAGEYLTLEVFQEKMKNCSVNTVYSPDLEPEIESLIHEINAEIVTDAQILNDDGYAEIRKLCQTVFNPLCGKQDILLLTSAREIAFSIPYAYTRLLPYVDEFKECYHRLHSAHSQQLFIELLRYEITKDLYFMNRITDLGEDSFDPLVFKLFKKAINADSFPNELLDQIVDLLNGDNKTAVQKQTLRGEFKARNRHFKQRKQAAAARLVQEKERPKNLIVFHLESLSNEIYRNHRSRFEHLNALMSQSIQLEKFYSSATSSAMALTYFLYGNDFELDSFTHFHEMSVKAKYGENLYHILDREGYSTLGIGYNFFPDTEEVNSHNVWNLEKNPYQWDNNFDQFLDKIETFIEGNKDKPFALHIWNLLTHSGQRNEETETCISFDERMDISYTSLDMTIQRTLDCLKKHKLMDNTIIAGYGDHGDDKWTRAMNDGFSHTIEPYTNVIETPAFLYSSSIEPLLWEEPVSLIDLKPTLLFILGIPHSESFEYGGINIFEKSNEFVYSQRLFANQRENDKIDSLEMIKLHHFKQREQKNKAYGIVGQRYSMVVSSRGMDFFFNKIDPLSYNNILSFFRIDDNGDIIAFDNRGAWRGHFRSIIMTDEQLYDFIRNYKSYRRKLMERIQAKHSRIDCEEKNLFDMNNFSKIRPRGFIED